MRQPTLFLTVGLPCTGKTTTARRIEIEQRALRLTKDEWVKALYPRPLGYECSELPTYRTSGCRVQRLLPRRYPALGLR